MALAKTGFPFGPMLSCRDVQYENVKKAQAEAQAQQQAEAGRQAKFDQQQQASLDWLS